METSLSPRSLDTRANLWLLWFACVSMHTAIGILRFVFYKEELPYIHIYNLNTIYC